ncbi:MAG: restriction endonuclease, partial [Pseudomonas sp.]
IFRQQILPLLQEYFFEDWQRIHWVLNDQNKEYDDQFVQEVKIDFMHLFGAKGPVDSHTQRWKLNDKAFDRFQTYYSINEIVR